MTRILNGLRRRLARACKWHPTSSPYISGDTFRLLAQHILDMDSTIEPAKVRDGDIVFVQSFQTMEYFKTIHPYITAKYILITHNGDENITSKHATNIDDRIQHWFAQNCLIDHPKITPLPIGVENKWYFQHGIPKYFDSLRSNPQDKKFRMLYKFSVSTNPSARGNALQILENHPLTETFNDWREPYAYLSTLQKYAFVVSPPGNGEDCIRTWEAMYLGTIPIVQRSVDTAYFDSLELPILLVDNYQELNQWDENTLKDIYATIKVRFETSALWADYWLKLIKTS